MQLYNSVNQTSGLRAFAYKSMLAICLKENCTGIMIERAKAIVQDSKDWNLSVVERRTLYQTTAQALDKLQDRRAAKSWLITILRREYARTFERKVPKFTDVDSVVVPEESELEPDDRAELDLLRRGILKLAPKYREPLLMQVRAE